MKQEHIDTFTQEVRRAIHINGDDLYNSPHEGLGICQEEMYELTKAIHENDNDNIAEEFMDLAIAAFWGYVSFSKISTGSKDSDKKFEYIEEWLKSDEAKLMWKEINESLVKIAKEFGKSIKTSNETIRTIIENKGNRNADK